MATYINNFIKEYENHFKNDTTFERVQYAGYLLDKYYPQFTQDATYYKALYEKCLKFSQNN